MQQFHFVIKRLSGNKSEVIEESAKTTSLSYTKEQMDDHLDSFKYDSGVNCNIDARYGTKDFISSPWSSIEPYAIAIRVLHMAGRYKIIGIIIPSGFYNNNYKYKPQTIARV